MELERLLLEIDNGSQEHLQEFHRYLLRRGFKGRLLRILQEELKKGSANSGRWRTFLWACSEGYLSTVQDLVKERKTLVTNYESKGLLKASKKGRLEVARFLMRSGAQIYWEHLSSCTLEVLKMLVEEDTRKDAFKTQTYVYALEIISSGVPEDKLEKVALLLRKGVTIPSTWYLLLRRFPGMKAYLEENGLGEFAR